MIILASLILGILGVTVHYFYVPKIQQSIGSCLIYFAGF